MDIINLISTIMEKEPQKWPGNPKEFKKLKRAWWGRTIYELMLTTNTSYKTLSEKAGIQENTLKKIIEGKYSPSFELMEYILAQLGCIFTIKLPF